MLKKNVKFALSDGRIRLAIRIVVTIGLLTYVIATAGIGRVMDTLAESDFPILLIAVFVDVFGVLISAEKWRLLLYSKGENASFSRIFELYFIGAFYNLALPTTVGGDAIRAKKLTNEINNANEAYSSIFVERFLGLIALLILAVGAAIYRPSVLTGRLWLGLAAVTGATIIISIIIFFRLFNRLSHSLELILPSFAIQKITDIVRSIRSYKGKSRTLGIVFLLSILFQLTPIANHFLVSMSLGLDLSIGILLVLVPVSSVILLLPISIQGYGLREALYVFFLTGSGISIQQAVAFSLIIQILAIVRNGLGGIFVVNE